MKTIEIPRMMAMQHLPALGALAVRAGESGVGHMRVGLLGLLVGLPSLCAGFVARLQRARPA